MGLPLRALSGEMPAANVLEEYLGLSRWMGLPLRALSDEMPAVLMKMRRVF